MQRLKDMQELDVQLHAIAQSRRQIEAEEAELGVELDRVQAMVDVLEEEIAELQGRRRELAQALAQEQENVKKAEGRLPSIKTQKEYVAVLKEIDTAKKMNKDIQERIQSTDGEIDALVRDRDEKLVQLQPLAARVSERREAIAADRARLEAELAEKSGQHEELLKEFPHNARRRYQTLLERRGGVAIVEARRGTCLGCNMQLPPQLYNSLFTQDEIQSCPHCHRLLYVVTEG
jgi:predicted  nucleic acid-binding Zn-ribbon protein